MRRYVGVVHKEATSDFGISFPDLPGCITAGKTMQVARRLAAEALALHLDSMTADGVAMPVARDLKAIRDDPEYAGATTLILVEAPAESNKGLSQPSDDGGGTSALGFTPKTNRW